MEINCKLVVTVQNNPPLFCALFTILLVILPAVEFLLPSLRVDFDTVGCHFRLRLYDKSSFRQRLQAKSYGAR